MSGHTGQLSPPQLSWLYQWTASATEPLKQDRGIWHKDAQGRKDSSDHRACQRTPQGLALAPELITFPLRGSIHSPSELFELLL